MNFRNLLLRNSKFFSPNLTPAYRSQYGSVNPTAIVATAVSTVTAVMFCKGMEAESVRGSSLFCTKVCRKSFGGVFSVL